MRSNGLPFLTLFSAALANTPLPLGLSLQQSDFESAQCLVANETRTPYLDEASKDDLFELRKRQSPCAAGYNSCSTLAVPFSNVCCPTTAVCSNDNVGNVACCPTGSFCTGTINPNTAAASTVVASTTTAAEGGGIVVVGGTATVTTPVASNTVPALTTTSLSYVPNAYFPFPYIQSTFANQASCLSAYSACTSNSAICSQDLAGSGGGYGVTIVAPGGGGVTVNAITTGGGLGAASASSICSSLESQACYGLQLSNCGVTATATATTTGFVVVSEGRRVELPTYLKVIVGGASVIYMVLSR